MASKKNDNGDPQGRENEEGIGQGLLYAPKSRLPQQMEESERSDVREALQQIMDKLSHLPADSLESVRTVLENWMKDASHTYGSAKQAVGRTKDLLADKFSSFRSPDPASVADEVRQDVLQKSEAAIPTAESSRAKSRL